MELKYSFKLVIVSGSTVLIIPYGIEMLIRTADKICLKLVLIIPYGIEINCRIFPVFIDSGFNHTLWN